MKSFSAVYDLATALAWAAGAAQHFPDKTVAIVPLETGMYMVATGYMTIEDLAPAAADATAQSREPVRCPCFDNRSFGEHPRCRLPVGHQGEHDGFHGRCPLRADDCLAAKDSLHASIARLERELENMTACGRKLSGYVDEHRARADKAEGERASIERECVALKWQRDELRKLDGAAPLPQDWPIQALQEVNEARRERDEWKQKAADAERRVFLANQSRRETEAMAQESAKGAYDSFLKLEGELKAARDAGARLPTCFEHHPERHEFICVFPQDHGGPYHGNPHVLWPKAP